MADEGFNFRPVERREAKKFEPPPWERDQFDQLERQRAEREAVAAREAEAARAQAEADAAWAAAEAAAAAEDADTRPASEAPLAADAAVPQVAEVPAAGGHAATDERQVERMLAELAAEEPASARSYWKTNVIVGSGLVIFGSVFLIWGIAGLVAAKGAGVAGMLGGTVMLIFGAGFVFGGMYVVVKNLRQRGVL